MLGFEAPNNFQVSKLSWGHLLRPLQRHLLEGVEIDLGIDEGRLQVAVTKYVGNLFQRMAPLDHSGCEAVAKRVSAFDGTLNS